MNKLIRYLTKLSLAGVVAVALLALGGTSILAPAWAAPPDKTTLGKLGCASGQIVRKDGTDSWVCDFEDWDKLLHIPEDIADGDDDTDTLGGLNCETAQIARWTGVDWVCSDDSVTDLQAQLDNLALLASRQASTFVFVSSTTRTGKLGGIAGADDICNGLAISAGLPGGPYKAWLATDIVNEDDPAHRFFRAPGAYILTNGNIVANDYFDLTDGGYPALRKPIDIDENGDSVPANAPVWTNVNAGGVANSSGFAPADHCDGWLSEVDTTGQIGNSSTFLHDGWTGSEGTAWGDCAVDYRLYCFGQ